MPCATATKHLSGLCWARSNIEPRNHYGWKRPLRSPSPTVTPTPPCLLNHVPKCHIHTVFEPLQGWGLPSCPGQPGPRPDHSFRKEIFPDLQSEPPLMQLEAIASRPVTGYLGEVRPCPSPWSPTPGTAPLMGPCQLRAEQGNRVTSLHPSLSWLQPCWWLVGCEGTVPSPAVPRNAQVLCRKAPSRPRAAAPCYPALGWRWAVLSFVIAVSSVLQPVQDSPVNARQLQ